MNKYLFDNTRRLYRIPPFRDAHIHFLKDGKPLAGDALPDVMVALVRRGIFQVHDMGHKSRVGLKARELWANRLRVKTAVSAICKKGGYGSFLGTCIGQAHEAATAVAEVAEAGADFIKVINSGVVDVTGGGVTAGGFTPGELKVICDEAATRRLGVSCHANGDEAIRAAVEAGVSSIEHGFFVSKETLRMMAERGVSWIPTAYALLNVGRSLPDDQRKYIEDVVARHLESIGYAASVGVTLRVGTDSGSTGVEHGSSLIEELRLFRKAGLSMEQIIAAACMDGDEISRGNYLIVQENFVELGAINEMSMQGQAYDPGALR